MVSARFFSGLCLVAISTTSSLHALSQRVLSLEVLDGPVSTYGNVALSVSDDGSVIAGGGGGDALLWKNGSFHTIQSDPKATFSRAVSGDATVVVGETAHSWSDGSFRWEDGVSEVLSMLPNHEGSIPYGISQDGRVIVGQSYEMGQNQAVRWVDGVIQGLGYLKETHTRSEARDVSADGTIIVGVSSSVRRSDSRIFRWENGVMEDIGQGAARAISPDGSTILAMSNGRPYIWKGGNQRALIPEFYDGGAEKLSNEGTVIVGWIGDDEGSADNAFAVIWASSTGYQTKVLNTLVDESGIDRQGFTLMAAYGINAAGTVVVGKGFYPESDGPRPSYAFKLTLSEPLTTWGAYPLEEGYANTDDWLGWIWPESEEWIWSLRLGKWLHIPPATAESGHGWVFVPN